MRTLSELYTLLYLDFHNRVWGRGTQFICCLINDMHTDNTITYEEYLLLINNFKRNRPTPELHPLFCNHELYSRTCYNWFGNGKYSYQVRTEFLNYLINNHIVDHEKVS